MWSAESALAVMQAREASARRISADTDDVPAPALPPLTKVIRRTSREEF